MANLKANRQVCDVHIASLTDKDANGKPKDFMCFSSANTTTVGLSGESTHAMAKGTRKISFQNPIEGTLSIEAQVYPFEYFSLFSDGKLETGTTKFWNSEEIKAKVDGKLYLAANDVKAGTVAVYKDGKIDTTNAISDASYANHTIQAAAIKAGQSYIVCYQVESTKAKKISFNNRKLPKDYYITMNTVDKDEDGVYTPFKVIAYKANIQRNFELSFSSEGDAATVTATFDLLEDANGNFLDMIEIDQTVEPDNWATGS